MPKGTYILSISILLSACCQVTKTYEVFSEPETGGLVYNEGSILLYSSLEGDSLQLITHDRFIGNKPSIQEDPLICDVYYPAYASIDLSDPKDSSDYFFRISIKKDNREKGLQNYISYAGYDYYLDDSVHVTYIDTLFAKGGGPYFNVYVIQTDSVLTDSTSLHRFFYNLEKGIFRMSYKDGKLFTLSE